MTLSKVVDNYLPDIVGKGYGEFWRDKSHRYIVCKGSRASKKSKTTALWIIYKMLEYPEANVLVVRRIYNTLRDSCYAELIWAINRLGVQHLFHTSKSSLTIEHKYTHQKILFRGLDNPLSVTSITVSTGYLCWCWIEEAYEIQEDAFNKIDLSLRGNLSSNLWYRFIITFNPWHVKSWLKSRFFDSPDELTLAMTTTWRCNEFLDDQTKLMFDIMKERNKKRWLVESEANWGVSSGLVFSNWEIQDFNLKDIPNSQSFTSVTGCDFGYADPTTIISSAVDTKNKVIYIYNELYRKYMTTDDIEKMVKENHLERVKIIADCSRPEIISQLNRKGCNFIGCKKGKDSIISGITAMQDYKFIIHPSCINVQTEFGLYCWDTDKDGTQLDKPIDANNHTIDALRYSLQDILKPKQISRVRSWN